MTGWRFFLVWMLTFLGFPVGGELAFLLVGSIDGAADGALGGGVAGAVIGAAQWLVLRWRLGMTPLWIAATVLGLALGDGVGAALTGAGTTIGDLLVTGVVSGIAVGLLQGALLLGERVRAPGAWPLVVALAWPLGWTVTCGRSAWMSSAATRCSARQGHSSSRRSPARRCYSSSADGTASPNTV